MLTNEAKSLGGKVTAVLLRKKAIENYYLNPNHCLYCNKIIEVPEGKKCGEIRRKKFCDKSCAARLNNCSRKQPKTIIPIKVKTNEEIINTKFKWVIGITKKELFDKSSNWQIARSSIQKHARFIYKLSDKPKQCFKCGYDKHYEVCHKKPVAKFDDSAIVNEDINNINNLLALCPTHHWEFDNGIFKIV